jgi:hypothetical protein
LFIGILALGSLLSFTKMGKFLMDIWVENGVTYQNVVFTGLLLLMVIVFGNSGKFLIAF